MATGVKGVTGGGLEADSYLRKGVEGDSYLMRVQIQIHDTWLGVWFQVPIGHHRQWFNQQPVWKMLQKDTTSRCLFGPQKNLTRQNKKHLKNDGTWKWCCCCWFPSTKNSKKPNHSCLLSDVLQELRCRDPGTLQTLPPGLCHPWPQSGEGLDITPEWRANGGSSISGAEI